ncbi:EpsG family protein [Streptococcus suis]
MKQMKVVELVGIIVTSILLSLRDGVGADLKTYHNHYEVIRRGFTPVVEFSDMGYRILEHTLARFDLSFHVFLFLISVFNLHTLFLFIKSQKLNYPSFALFIALGIFDLFFYSLSAIRQSIAISFVLLAVLALNQSKKKLSVFYLLLATTFHWTAIAMLPTLFIIDMKKKIRASLLFTLVVLFPMLYYVTINSPFVIDKLSALNYNMYYYLKILPATQSTSLISFMLGLLVVILWVLYKLYFVGIVDDGLKLSIRKLKSLSVYIEMTIVDWFVFIFLLLHACVDLVYVSAIPRIEMYFYAVLPIFIAKELEKQSRGIATLSLLMLSIVILAQLYFKIQTNLIHYGEAKFILPF